MRDQFTVLYTHLQVITAHVDRSERCYKPQPRRQQQQHSIKILQAPGGDSDNHHPLKNLHNSNNDSHGVQWTEKKRICALVDTYCIIDAARETSRSVKISLLQGGLSIHAINVINDLHER